MKNERLAEILEQLEILRKSSEDYQKAYKKAYEEFLKKFSEEYHSPFAEFWKANPKIDKYDLKDELQEMVFHNEISLADLPIDYRIANPTLYAYAKRSSRDRKYEGFEKLFPLLQSDFEYAKSQKNIDCDIEKIESEIQNYVLEKAEYYYEKIREEAQKINTSKAFKACEKFKEESEKFKELIAENKKTIAEYNEWLENYKYKEE